MFKYRVIVAGSRSFNDYNIMEAVVDDVMKLVL